MIRKLFAYDGKLMGFLNKTGEIILVNIVFLLCCIPVVTTGPALTSFYYAMIKSVRRERGGPVQEFFRSMKRTLGRGSLLTLGILVWMALLFFSRHAMRVSAQAEVTSAIVLCDVLIAVSVCVLLYVFPVFSRFDMRMGKILKLSFVMSIRFLPTTLLIAAGSAAIGWLLFYQLPMACILIVPGVWCYLVTFLMERALRAYMPKAGSGEEQWYDGAEKQEEK